MTLTEDSEALREEARDRVGRLGRAPETTLFVLLRRYRRTEGAVSATWMVDHHVIESLRLAGWQPVPELSSETLRIEAFRPALGEGP